MIIKPLKFLLGDIENENQVTLLVGDYKNPIRDIKFLGQSSGSHFLISFVKELIL